jgi:hypothetical protein
VTKVSDKYTSSTLLHIVAFRVMTLYSLSTTCVSEERTISMFRMKILGFLLWHVCWKPELGSQHRQLLPRNGSGNMAVVRQCLNSHHVTSATNMHATIRRAVRSGVLCAIGRGGCVTLQYSSCKKRLSCGVCPKSISGEPQTVVSNPSRVRRRSQSKKGGQRQSSRVSVGG